jgi:putative multiple sugar transport system permease protein
MKTLAINNIRQWMMVFILVLITIVLQIATNGILLMPQNVSNLIQQNAYVIIIAVGMMVCIITGGNIDLSVGSIMAFIGALCGILMIGAKWNVWLVLGLCIAVSILAGMWHGFWISRYNVPSFIATLSGMLIFRGLTYATLGGKTYFSYPERFLSLTTGFLKDYLGSSGQLHVTTIVLGCFVAFAYILIECRKRSQRKKNKIALIAAKYFVLKIVTVSTVIMLFMYRLAQYKGMPIVLIPVAICVVVYGYILNNTVTGRRIYALGGNPKAAYLSGINVKKTLFLVYVNSAFLAAIAGFVFSARINSATPKAGEGFELDAIAACYIGGASASGGIGSISGAMIGALVMGLLNNGMSILGIDINIQMLVKGLVLLLAVVFDLAQKSKRG